MGGVAYRGTRPLLSSCPGSRWLGDRVVTGDVEGFKRYIVLYVILSAITGAIGSVQQLCFRLAGFRMAIGARNKLFKGVLSQVR